MSQEVYYAGEIGLWFQRDCGEELEFLGCHNLTSVSVPRGDTNPTYCRVGKNKFAVKRTWRGTPGLGSATVVAYDTVLNYLQELPCPTNLYAMHSACGADEDPTNYDYVYIYEGVEPTSEDTDTHVVGMSQDDQTEVMLSMPVTFRNRLKVKTLTAKPLDVSGVTTQDVNSIAFCDEPECGDLCGDSSIGCQTGFFVTNGNGGAAVIGSITKGGDTVATIASPFTVATNDINVVKCDGNLVIVSNGVDTAYAYSWDGGANFTEVLTPTQLINDILIYGGAKIWMVGQNGYIWHSSNRGASISVQDAGSATAQSLNAIAVANSLLLYAVGDNNAFVRTEDGGTIWSAVTGPASMIFPNDLYDVVAIPGTNIVLVADEQGNLYRSTDKGDSWTTIMTGYSALAGGIYGIVAPDCNILAVIGNDQDPYFYSNPTGAMYQSIDGGVSWNAIELPSNTGLLDIHACDVNTYWLAGNDGFVAKVSGPSI